MLKRPLLYTAITRAKQKVVIVGERKAVCMAIGRLDMEKRGTMLARRIQEKQEETTNEQYNVGLLQGAKRCAGRTG